MAWKLFFITLVLCVCSACGSSGGGGDAGSEIAGGGNGGTGISPGSVTDKGATLCGVVVDGDYRNPPNVHDGKQVISITPLDSNLVQVTTSDGKTILVQLQALGSTSSFDNTAAKKEMNALLASDSVYFYQAGSCSVDTSAGKAVLGQLVTESGTSFSEELLEENFAGVIETSGSCGTADLGVCYEAISGASTGLEEDNGDTEIDEPAVVGKQVSNFLWKPDSESAYNHGGVSILTNPCDVKVLVNGQEIREYPTGNGRCVTVRSASPGCDFGTNIKVEVIDKKSGAPVYFGDKAFATIPNGCERFEFSGTGGGGADRPVSSGGGGAVAHACATAPATVQYSPSLEACGGNAAVILSGGYTGAFSVQLRLPDGGDRLDKECALAGCSPYKVQQYLDGAGTKTACFGAPGNANLMEDVHHVSIKMDGLDSNPDRFCIPNPDRPVNG